MEIHSLADWWKCADDNWDYLIRIISSKMDLSHDAFDPPGNAKGKKTGRNIGAEIKYLKKNRDPKLSRYFHATWGLSSNAYAWSVEGWGELCELCSEDWVFEDEEVTDDGNTV